MERRALLAAALCLLVLLVYQEAVRYFYPPPLPTPDADTFPTPAPQAAKPEGRPLASADGEPPSAATVPEGKVVPIETELYSTTLSTVGGRLTSFRLKHFRESIREDSEPLNMVIGGPGMPAPLGVTLVVAKEPSQSDAKATPGEDPSAAYRVIGDDSQVAYSVDHEAVSLAGDETGVLTLTGVLPSGARIEKRIELHGNTYPIGVSVRASGFPEANRIGLEWLRRTDTEQASDPEAYYRSAMLLQGRKLVYETASDLFALDPDPRSGERGRRFAGPLGWVGYADHYFVTAIAPEEPDKAEAILAAVTFKDPQKAEAALGAVTAGIRLLVTTPRRAGDDEANRFTLYVGPKDIDVLASAGHELARAVDFGWFSFLAAPLLRLLKLFHTVTGNYGVDIILLTMLMKVLFVPLFNKQMKSMKDMQRLQPQLTKLREKFKDDRERLNKEMIELYRRHRVNPLGGCLPMALQLPVFIGLYQALNQSIELRHARFALWIKDLSTYECYPWPGQAVGTACNDLNVLGVPIPLLLLLMGGSMLLQMWLTPATGMDPAQQRMMLVLMPVMMTVMFLTFPSGLVLYWLVSNVLTIAQQWWVNRAAA